MGGEGRNIPHFCNKFVLKRNFSSRFVSSKEREGINKTGIPAIKFRKLLDICIYIYKTTNIIKSNIFRVKSRRIDDGTILLCKII